MFSSNSFNVCPHCGKANTLNARYCSSCGKQLTMPQEVVICHRCHKTNPPMASFCGGCGAPLRVGAKTRMCPNCHREIDANASICSCGYDFAQIQHAEAAAATGALEQTAVNLAEEQPKESKKDAAATRVEPMYRHKGGRGIAFVVLLLTLILAFLVVTPNALLDVNGGFVMDENSPTDVKKVRFQFLTDFDKGIFYTDEDPSKGFSAPLYGYNLFQLVLFTFQNAEALAEQNMTPLQSLQETLGSGGLAIVVMLALFVIVVVLQIIISIIRIFTGKRPKRISYLNLILAVLTTLWTLVAFFIGMFVDPASEQSFLVQLYTIFSPATYNIGYVAFLIPVTFWVLFLMSIAGKARIVEEDVA